jgi:hypothetical protein
MNKLKRILLWLVGSIGILTLIFFLIVSPILKKNTKKFSPEHNVVYTQGDLQIDVFYCSPSKKGRKIFGGLVPYGEVWRTGANEATTFTTNKDLIIDGKKLVTGNYSIWTIPEKDSWTIIFNNKMYNWGIKRGSGKAARDSDFDALTTEAKVSRSLTTNESFSITLNEIEPGTTVMLFSWDNVVVPLEIKKK